MAPAARQTFIPIAVASRVCENRLVGILHLANPQYCFGGFHGTSFPWVKAVTHLGRVRSASSGGLRAHHATPRWSQRLVGSDRSLRESTWAVGPCVSQESAGFIRGSVKRLAHYPRLRAWDAPEMGAYNHLRAPLRKLSDTPCALRDVRRGAWRGRSSRSPAIRRRVEPQQNRGQKRGWPNLTALLCSRVPACARSVNG